MSANRETAYAEGFGDSRAHNRLLGGRNQFKMPKQTDLSGALFDGANLIFANMATANLRDAILVRADLSNADLSGAELAGADFTGANIYGTVFKGAKGLAEVKGLDHARNRDKAIF